jgi:predicted TIM-barrel enzyme
VDRTAALARIRESIRQGRPVIGAGAGAGISAKAAEAGGDDLIVIPERAIKQQVLDFKSIELGK